MNMHFPLHSVFLAIPLEGPAKNAFRELQRRLEQHGDILLFQNHETPHLTLQFWKEVMEIEYFQITTQAKKIADASAPFMLKTQGISMFGSRGEDRILYLDVPFSEELARLKKRCPWTSGEQFAPHVTLARIRHPQKFAVRKKKIMKLIGDAAFEVTVDRLRLYAAVGGANQTMIDEFLF
ncbi:RNA 2',3'-cyclic phosphodiesterase [Candidatus Peregrinibacteria bacterium]|nr:RNA 2',3'-cyclic phosphodiesterase [Candidatus Peregrinibacteria bacterium]